MKKFEKIFRFNKYFGLSILFLLPSLLISIIGFINFLKENSKVPIIYFFFIPGIGLSLIAMLANFASVIRDRKKYKKGTILDDLWLVLSWFIMWTLAFHIMILPSQSLIWLISIMLSLISLIIGIVRNLNRRKEDGF
ncbi:MAG: hypothetical protein LBI13_05115 [Streptococcaceae bacterium]|jgi:heme exporter protein D|nr:hypothetical protein [Streptococcaceae bacterium]